MNFLQKEVIEVTDIDENGDLDIDMVNDQLGYLFVTDNDEPIKGLKAYHRDGSAFIELSLHGVNDVTDIDHLKPVLVFPSENALRRYIDSKRVSYRRYDENESFANNLLRKIDIGTHLPVFVNHVQMQQQNFNYLELTHRDDRFNVSGNIQEYSQGKKLKDLYFVDDKLKFSWIVAGAHGKAGDADIGV